MLVMYINRQEWGFRRQSNKFEHFYVEFGVFVVVQALVFTEAAYFRSSGKSPLYLGTLRDGYSVGLSQSLAIGQERGHRFCGSSKRWPAQDHQGV